ncbi:hypothetical protein HW555_000437, partial [Spodoptera exigua]
YFCGNIFHLDKEIKQCTSRHILLGRIRRPRIGISCELTIRLLLARARTVPHVDLEAMDVNSLAILYWYYRRQRRRKRLWLNPIVQRRSTVGAFTTLMQQLRNDPQKFFNYFRMTIPTFDNLLKKVEKDLKKRDTNMRKSIRPEEKLAICIRYMASGCSYKDLHYAYRVGVSTISNIIKEVTNAIWNNLHGDRSCALARRIN